MEQGRLVESGRLQSLYRREGQQLLIAVLEPDLAAGDIFRGASFGDGSK